MEHAMALSPFTAFDLDPFAALRRLQSEVDRAFGAPSRAGSYPAVNIWQGPDSVAVTAELPGVLPADIEISVKEDLVTISGTRKPPESAAEVVWHRRERDFGRFSRVIQLPYRVDPDRVEARLQDGVLQVEMHRPEADKPRRIEIKAD
jgi:HSP20 family protein